MTLPASGQAISFSNIDTELNASSTAQVSLNCTAVRNMAGSASGAVSMTSLQGKSSHPNPPTSVSNSCVCSTSAKITFSAPSYTGAGSITGYTVTGSPGGSATGASSPISVTGLTGGTCYSFTVKATNAYGCSSASSATTFKTKNAGGSSYFPGIGTYSWAVPSGVTSVSAVAVSGGGQGSCYNSGGGGGLSFKNNATLYPLKPSFFCSNYGGCVVYGYYVVVNGSFAPYGQQCNGSFCNRNTMFGSGHYCLGNSLISICCQPNGSGGYAGRIVRSYYGNNNVPGTGGTWCGNNSGGASGGCGKNGYQSGGGAAAGYASNGANGGWSVGFCNYGNSFNHTDAQSGSTGGGGGGGAPGRSFHGSGNKNTRLGAGGSGGGTGIQTGQGSAGGAGNTGNYGYCVQVTVAGAGGGGSGGTGGQYGRLYSNSAYRRQYYYCNIGTGGFPGGGGSSGWGSSSYGCGCRGGLGGQGALRIVWPGATRQFPSTCVGSP